MRFLAGTLKLPEPEIMHFTHVDYDRNMAFVVFGRTCRDLNLGDTWGRAGCARFSRTT